MAKIHQEEISIKISKLVKGDSETTCVIPEEVLASIEAVITELLADPSLLIEVGHTCG